MFVGVDLDIFIYNVLVNLLYDIHYFCVVALLTGFAVSAVFASILYVSPTVSARILLTLQEETFLLINI